MIAGRSAWLCQGTMPPGSIVSLRKRSCRSLVGRLLLEVDGGQHRVGHALARMGDRCADVRLEFAGGAFARRGYQDTGERRPRDHSSQHKASAERAATCNAIEHGRGLLCLSPGRSEAVAARRIDRMGGERKCRLALVSIADCYGKKTQALPMAPVSNYFAITLDVIDAMTVDAILN